MLRRESAALVIIDFQDRLLPKIPVGNAVVAQAVRLIALARELGMPCILTEQYPKGLGPTCPGIRDAAGLDAIEKTAFGCFGEPGFVQALKNTHCSQIILTGIETHVCVMQTALAAVDSGYRVFVPVDAVGSREKRQHEAGLARMERKGAELVTVEMAMFELVREAGTPEFKRVLPLMKQA